MFTFRSILNELNVMIQIYHNPQCSTSREGLEILKKSGNQFEVIPYLKNPPSKEELESIIKKLKIKPIGLVRVNEPIWKEQFKDKNLSDEAVIDAMVQNPILMERPVVVNGNKAAIGRPVDKISSVIRGL